MSSCEKTTKGVTGVTLQNLKILIVTKYHKSVAFELIYLRIEDCIRIDCENLVPEEKLKE